MARAKPVLEESPAHHPPQLRSTVRDLVAIRIDGVTYCVPAGAVEAFRAKYARTAREGARYGL